jgi:hypothetical protein
MHVPPLDIQFSKAILKTNNYVSSHVIEHKNYHDIQKCMARHKCVAGLNMLMGSQSTLLLRIGCQAAAHAFVLFSNTVEQVMVNFHNPTAITLKIYNL